MSVLSRPPLFELQNVVSGERSTLVLSGEIDLVAAPDVEAAIRHLCAQRTSRIVLDLRKVTFMDSTGLKAAISAQALCQAQGHEFGVIPGPRQVQTLFEITGLAKLLPFEEHPVSQPDVEREPILHMLFAPGKPRTVGEMAVELADRDWR